MNDAFRVWTDEDAIRVAGLVSGQILKAIMTQVGWREYRIAPTVLADADALGMHTRCEIRKLIRIETEKVLLKVAKDLGYVRRRTK